MSSIVVGLQFLNNQILKMKWLDYLIKLFVTNVLGLDIGDRIGNSIYFFLYDSIKIILLLSILLYFISYIQYAFSPKKTKKILGKFKGLKGSIMGAILGIVTPFCSCSTIPIFIGFVKAGLPLGITFAFLISSPLIDFVSIFLIASIFNWNIAIIYVMTGLILAIIGGVIVDHLQLEKHLEPFITKNIHNSEEISPDNISRREYARRQVISIIKRLWIYILIGVFIGSLIYNWIPNNMIVSILGSTNGYAVLIAAIIGIPMYADIYSTLPIAEALMTRGVSIGTILSFMMATTAISLPSIILLHKVAKNKLIVIFIAIIIIGIILMGYLFNYLSYLLI